MALIPNATNSLIKLNSYLDNSWFFGIFCRAMTLELPIKAQKWGVTQADCVLTELLCNRWRIFEPKSTYAIAASNPPIPTKRTVSPVSN